MITSRITNTNTRWLLSHSCDTSTKYQFSCDVVKLLLCSCVLYIGDGKTD